MNVWRQGTTASQAIKDNWIHDIPLYQTREELYEHFRISFPLDVLEELYSLYYYQMNTQEEEQV